MASQLNSLNFSNYAYHKNPFRLISDVKKEFNGILTGLTGCLGVTEYIDYFMIMEREDYLSQLDTTSYSTFEFALMHPNVDENGENPFVLIFYIQTDKTKRSREKFHGNALFKL